MSTGDLFTPATDKVWASRQLLLTGYEHLTVKQKARFNAALAAEDPTEAPWVSFRGWTGAGAVVVG